MKNPKYNKEIKPNVIVDVYDVLEAWQVKNPALQHMIKKALQAGNRGHKDIIEDMDDIIACSIRAKEIEEENIKKSKHDETEDLTVNFLYI
jgi:hypothetical protein